MSYELAVRPGANVVSRGTANVGRVFSPTMDKYVDPDAFSLHWTNTYTGFWWARLGLLLLMLGLPVSFIALSLWTLLGYTALAAVPVLVRSTKKNYSNKWTHRQAHLWLNELDQAWREHAEVFYRQIWNHDCDGEKHTHERYVCQDYNYKYVCKIKWTKCSYCEKRLNEINELCLSKKSLENKSTSETDKIIFESSEQFRKAIAEQLEQPKLMRQISEGVSNGKSR